MGNVGRPRKEGFEKIIKVAVDDETAQEFNELAKKNGKSKTDILRELLPWISSKEFERLIAESRMEALQEISKNCWEMLHVKGCLFESIKFSDVFPGFVTNHVLPRVYVKYPTYKIVVFSKKNEKKIETKEIENLIKNVQNVSPVYVSPFHSVGEQGVITEYVNEVLCIGISLEENLICREEVTKILKEHMYDVSTVPSFCLRWEQIEYLENGKYFRIAEK